MSEHAPIVWLVVIANTSIKDKLLKGLGEHGAVLFNSTYGRGTARSQILETLGFSVEPRKVILTSFVKKSNVANVFNYLTSVCKFNQPNTGFAFTIPIEKVTY